MKNLSQDVQRKMVCKAKLPTDMQESLGDVYEKRVCKLQLALKHEGFISACTKQMAYDPNLLPNRKAFLRNVRTRVRSKNSEVKLLVAVHIFKPLFVRVHSSLRECLHPLEVRIPTILGASCALLRIKTAARSRDVNSIYEPLLILLILDVSGSSQTAIAIER